MQFRNHRLRIDRRQQRNAAESLRLVGDERGKLIVHQPRHLRRQGSVARHAGKCLKPRHRDHDMDIDLIAIQQIDPRFQIGQRRLQPDRGIDCGRPALLFLERIEKFRR